jgi:NAD(P)-dependent dehydrogenase (short-subunit alcohol dehydrogenase family)
MSFAWCQAGRGSVGFYLASVYCASKAAIVGFALSMGMADQEEGFKVVYACSGWVRFLLLAGDSKP